MRQYRAEKDMSYKHSRNRLRQMKQWWVAPTCSTLFGNALDTIAFLRVTEKLIYAGALDQLGPEKNQ